MKEMLVASLGAVPLSVVGVMLKVVTKGGVVSGGGMVVKVAVADFPLLILTVHVVAVPVHAPDQPLNVEPEDGVAVRITLVPSV